MVKITINGQEIPRLIDYDITPEPLWGDDTGRECDDGHFSGTLIGYFTNLDLIIGSTTQEELGIIKNMLEKAIIPLTYPSDKNGLSVTENFYGTAIKTKKKSYKGKYSGFTISLKAIDRRL